MCFLNDVNNVLSQNHPKAYQCVLYVLLAQNAPYCSATWYSLMLLDCLENKK